VSATTASRVPALTLAGATLGVNGRTLWSGLDLEVAAGEFVAVLGANGSGKTSLLRSVLGQRELDRGDILVGGRPVRRGDPHIGYVPQQRPVAAGTPLRGRDFVGLGVDGHRFGIPLPSAGKRARVDAVLAETESTALADAPVARLSGGEQQRLRVAQALVGDPGLLLCDEPLISLDLHNQALIAALLERRRREHGTAIVFVTHDINPVLGLVDRVLYLANGRFRIGTPDEVLTSETLSALYDTRVDVVRTGDRIAVFGAPAADEHHADEHHAHGEHA
jgi:zinc/manganese transport system ATP-binding protein